MFGRFAAATGTPVDPDAVFDALFREALEGKPMPAGSSRTTTSRASRSSGLDAGRPLFVRTPDSRLTLANFMRAQLYGVFGTLSLGMRVLDDEGVALDRIFAHGGMFRTAGVAHRFLAGALQTPVGVGETASEGGAWGAAVLASYLLHAADTDLAGYLDERIFRAADTQVVEPNPDDVVGFATYLNRYELGLAVEQAAAEVLK